MRIPKIIKNASSQANKLTAWSILFLATKVLLLNRIPAPIVGIYELGVILEGILISIVASYIFYLFVVHFKELSDKEILNPYISKQTIQIIGDCESQLAQISKASGISLELASITEDKIHQAFSKINPCSQAPLIFAAQNTQANWLQYFDFHKRETKERIKRLLAQIIYLDTRHIKILTEIDDCTHFSFIETLVVVKLKCTDMSFLADIFYRYCKSISTLNEYYINSNMSLESNQK